MKSLLKRVIALILVLILTSANLILIGEHTLSLAISDDELNSQNSKTNNKNVEFNSYFYENTHDKTFPIDSDEAKIYVNINVKNEGYIENGVIEFQNSNFKLKEKIENEYIQKIDIENNKVVLNKLNNGKNITLELPIQIDKKENISPDYFSKDTLTKFTGTYVDAKGNEVKIEKTITNRLSWQGEAEADLTLTPTKFIPYATDGIYGVMVQVKVTSSVKDNTLPIKTTNIELGVPTINSVIPTSVKVIALSMQATNGKTDGIDFTNSNYVYDAENSKVVLNVSNQDNNISWKVNAQDEYLVTYIFEGKEIYEFASENGIDCSIKANSNLVVYNNTEENISKDVEANIKYEEKEGSTTDFKIYTPSDISKGYMYTNFETNDKKETEYTEKFQATINDAEITNYIEFEQDTDKFLTKNGQEKSTSIDKNNFVYNKKVQISKKVFDKILGQEGQIILKDAEGIELGRINKDSKVENDAYILDIQDKNNNKLIITTTAPITEGQLEITVIKAIKGNIGYSKEEVSSFEKVELGFKGKTNITTFLSKRRNTIKRTRNKSRIRNK